MVLAAGRWLCKPWVVSSETSSTFEWPSPGLINDLLVWAQNTPCRRATVVCRRVWQDLAGRTMSSIPVMGAGLLAHGICIGMTIENINKKQLVRVGGIAQTLDLQLCKTRRSEENIRWPSFGASVLHVLRHRRMHFLVHLRVAAGMATFVHHSAGHKKERKERARNKPEKKTRARGSSDYHSAS